MLETFEAGLPGWERVGNDELAVGGVAHDPNTWTPDLVGDVFQVDQILLADPGAALERPRRNLISMPASMFSEPPKAMLLLPAKI